MENRPFSRRDMLKSTGVAAVSLGTPLSVQTVSADGEDPDECVDNPRPTEGAADVLASVTHDSGDTLTLTYEPKDGADTLKVELRADESVGAVYGFAERDGVYVWDGETERPNITYDATSVSQYDWGSGVFVTPDHPDSTVRLTAEQGVVSRELMYVGGKYSEGRVQRGCEEIRVIVPCGVHIRSTLKDVLDSLSTASAHLDVGHRFGTTTVFAAPDVRGLGLLGVYLGDGDAAVRGSISTNSPGDTWAHEYVHGRQADNLGTRMEWFTEASATYYASHVPLERGTVTASEHERYINRGLDHGDVILSEPHTWEGTRGNYEKGALVLANLDQRIRAESDGEYSLETVFRDMNGRDQVRFEDFLALVGKRADASTGKWLETFATTDRMPPSYVYQGGKGAGFDAYMVKAKNVLASASQWAANFLAPPGECGRTGYLF